MNKILAIQIWYFAFLVIATIAAVYLRHHPLALVVLAVTGVLVVVIVSIKMAHLVRQNLDSP